MTPCCPKCDSSKIIVKNYAKKACSVIGSLAGAAGVASSVVRGTIVGADGGLVIGPVGMVIGGITGAIIGGIIGGTTGGATGAKLGEFVDNHILNNYACLDCHYSFSYKIELQRNDEFSMESAFSTRQHKRNSYPPAFYRPDMPSFEDDEEEPEFI